MVDHRLVAILAICEGDAPSAGGVIIAGLVALCFFGVVAVVAWTGGREAWRLAGVYVGAAVSGVLIARATDAVSSDGLGTFWATIVAGGALGLGVSLLRRRMPGRYVSLGLVGGATWLPGLLLFAIAWLSATGGCID